MDARYDYLTGSSNDIISLLSLHFQYLKALKLNYNQFSGSSLSSNNTHDNNEDRNITITTIINSTSSSMSLHALSMSSNNFIGTLSSNTSKLKYLKHIDMSNNQFYGAIASLSFDTLQYLDHLHFHYNNFEGCVNADNDAFLSRIYNKDNTNYFGKMGKLKDLAAYCLLIDKYDEDDDG